MAGYPRHGAAEQRLAWQEPDDRRRSGQYCILGRKMDEKDRILYLGQGLVTTPLRVGETHTQTYSHTRWTIGEMDETSK